MLLNKKNNASLAQEIFIRRTDPIRYLGTRFFRARDSSMHEAIIARRVKTGLKRGGQYIYLLLPLLL